MSEKKLVQLDTGKQWGTIQFPKNDEDPRWMPDLSRPVPKWLVENIAKRGIQVPPDVTEGSSEPLVYLINDGRKRLRAVPDANKLRADPAWAKKNGFPGPLPPLVIPLLVSHRTEDEAMDTADELNEFRVTTDPVLKAEIMSRRIDLGQTEEEIGERFHMSAQHVREHLVLLRASRRIQELVQEGRLSVSAVAAIYKKHPKAAEEEAIALVQKAEQVTGKVATTREVSGKGPGRMGMRAVNQLILNLQSSKIAGPAGENIKWAGVAILQAVQDESKLKTLWEVLEHISKGRFPEKPDFTKEQKIADRANK